MVRNSTIPRHRSFYSCLDFVPFTQNKIFVITYGFFFGKNKKERTKKNQEKHFFDLKLFDFIKQIK